ncbi:MAG: dehydratase [Actinobacteria bacterium 13_2_20CM_2_71_6]|nr:MAG: dehydratase [Actinobacteria bacterium 13_2_20CM_2_71_6]
MPTVVSEPKVLLDLAGTSFGTSQWLPVSQDRVDRFAVATGDHQWIHVDPERARCGPYGGTIAHGYLTLSLAPVFLAELLTVEKALAAVNYGIEKVRFPAPVPVGASIRCHLTLVSARERGAGIEAVFHLVYEVTGTDRPACVADVVVLYQ